MIRKAPFVHQRLLERALSESDRPLYTFLREGGEGTARLTAGDLDRRARGVAAALGEVCAPGDRALLLFPAGLDFIAAFFGCLYAGVIAVPAYPPHPRRGHERLRAIARGSRPAVVLTSAESLSAVESAAARIPEIAAVPRRVCDSLAGIGPAEGAPDFEPAPETPAFLQYTSGSTGTPKGVIVTHGNLAHNEEMIRQAFGQGPDSVVVGWLPLYHDMGLIGNVLQPLWAGASCVLMSPVAFLQRPRRWLEAIQRYGGTTSGGPNFAYELCVEKIPPAEREGLDLSTWRVAFNGAEPVRAATLSRFAEAFAPAGFRREAFYPCYGLAEATLFVAGPRRGEPAAVAAFDAEALAADQALPAGEDDPEVRRLVGCGAAWSGQRVAVVDPATARELPEGRVGEIWVAGPSVAAGYWEQPEETARDFGARLAGEAGGGPFLRTGDLGFVSGGELFIVGRAKDLIILRGRNHYPQDFEVTVEASHPDLRPGGVAAVSVDAGGEERLVIVAEVDRRREGALDPEEIAAAVLRAVAEEHEARVHEVVLIRAGTLPKTSSGKVRRGATRADFLADALQAVGRMALPEAPEPEAAGAPLDRRALLGLPAAERLPALAAHLQWELARAVRLPVSRLDPAQPLVRQGLDSLAAVELQHGLETAFGLRIEPGALLDGGSLDDLAAELCARLEAEVPEPERAAPALEAAEHPLSDGQKALWFLHRLAPASVADHIVVAARASSALDLAALHRACRALAARHPALRTTFHAPEGEPWQRVESEPAVELIARETGEEGAELEARLYREVYRPFDLETGPLLRVVALALPDGGHALAIALPHIAGDFQSLTVIARELGALYAEETGGPPAALPPLRATYLDFVDWQRELLAGPEGERLWAYWRETLAGAPSSLNLPTDRPRPPVQTYAGSSESLRIDAGAAGALRELARGEGCTPFMALYAAFLVLLQRHSGQDDLLVGTPLAGRGAPRFAEVVGYFVNPVVLRTGLGGNPTVAELLAAARRTVTGALRHPDYPFALLAERLQPQRDPSRPPIVEVVLVMEQAVREEERSLPAFALGEPGARLRLGGLELESARLESRAAQRDLTLGVAELEGDLLLSLRYNTDLYDAATARRALAHFQSLASALAEDPRRRISELPMLAAAERDQLALWSAGLPCPPGDRCVHELIEEQARLRPEAVALVAGERSLTYAELNGRANRLARHLRSRGIGPEHRVGVFLGRTPELVTALVGVLKSGGAYVPLDPAYPSDRLRFMVEDSRCGALVTEAARLEQLGPLPGIEGVCVDGWPEGDESDPPPLAVPGNLAYVMYTSGSTGRPKGVAIEHHSTAQLVHWSRGFFTPEELSGVLASTSICFDVSVFELLVTLSLGGRILLAESSLAFPELAAAGEVRLVCTVPTAMGELIGRLPASVTTANLGGEPLKASLVERIFAGQPAVERIYNCYGPSEATTYSTVSLSKRGDTGEPTIGRPVADNRLWVLDRFLQLAPAGVVGELYLGGESLARGYLDRPALTAERFLPHPFGERPGERIYRTGDLVRYRPDGQLDHLGRADSQVKVRGFRIELGEVEAALARHPAVRAVSLVLWRPEGGEPHLVAYLAPEGAAPSIRELRAHVAALLPEYMVPSFFVFLDALPLTPNGKVDRRALPPPDVQAASETAAPRTATEELLLGIWVEVLGLERAGVHDNFFDLGGHSLLATRISSRVRQVFGVELPLARLFQLPTAHGLARFLDAARRGGGESEEEPLRAGPRPPEIPLSWGQERLWFLQRLAPESPVLNIAHAFRLSGALDVAALAASLGEIRRRHEALRTRILEMDGVPRQEVLPPRSSMSSMSQPLPVIDLSELPGREREMRRLAEAVVELPFDLAAGRPLRVALLRLGEREHVLAMTVHHIAADGWSLEVLLGELAELYEAFTQARAPRLPALPCQYVDFALWQRRWLEGAAAAGQLAYWRRQLAGAPPAPVLPGQRERAATPRFRGAVHRFEIPPETSAALLRLSRAEASTPFMTLFAGFAALLHQATGETDLLVGTNVAQRNREEVEGLLGFFVNNLTLRADLSGDPSFRGLLARVREMTLAAYAHQDVPFERVLAEVQPQRHGSYAPLFKAMFVMQSFLPLAWRLPGLETAPVELAHHTANFDLMVLMAEGEDRLLGAFVFDTDVFEPAAVARLAGQLEALLAGAAADPDQPLSGLGGGDDPEAFLLADQFNEGPAL